MRTIAKIVRIHIVGVTCVAINIEGWLKICTSDLVYSQIWLHLPREDCHLGYTKQFLKQTLMVLSRLVYCLISYTKLVGSLITVLGGKNQIKIESSFWNQKQFFYFWRTRPQTRFSILFIFLKNWNQNQGIWKENTKNQGAHQRLTIGYNFGYLEKFDFQNQN
jgi:hypothetical protein